jgi:polyhydroxybutyrate depolymerase
MSKEAIMRHPPGLVSLVLIGSALACAADEAKTEKQPYVPDPLVVARPYELVVPTGYQAEKPTPLLILLHGYGASALIQDGYWGIGLLAEEKTFLYAYPDGQVDESGKQFWNATDACCDFFQTETDDVAYVTAVIKDMQAQYNVDAKRIFVIGHSNGGFMSHRMACDRSELIAGIVSLAGATWEASAMCQPTAPVAVLQAHGTDDSSIAYDGNGAYPSAHASVQFWADFNKCSKDLVDTGVTMDLDAKVDGAETKVERHTDCAGGAAELWTLEGAPHTPRFYATWRQALYDFLMAHPKP